MGVDEAQRAMLGNLIDLRWCLDFTNTVAVHDGSSPYDEVGTYAALVAWSRDAGLLTERESESLRQVAARRPADADAVLHEARALREALYRLLSPRTPGTASAGADLALLNGVLARALAQVHLDLTPDGVAWSWKGRGALDAMLWPVAASAAALLCSTEVKNVRECEGRACTWLFLDTTKNHSRRYCRSEGCGNRARARRHYARRRGDGARR